MASRADLDARRAELSKSKGIKATDVSSIESRMTVLMEKHGFTKEEAESAVMTNPAISSDRPTKIVRQGSHSQASRGEHSSESHKNRRSKVEPILRVPTPAQVPPNSGALNRPQEAVKGALHTTKASSHGLCRGEKRVRAIPTEGLTATGTETFFGDKENEDEGLTKATAKEDANETSVKPVGGDKKVNARLSTAPKPTSGSKVVSTNSAPGTIVATVAFSEDLRRIPRQTIQNDFHMPGSYPTEFGKNTTKKQTPSSVEKDFVRSGQCSTNPSTRTKCARKVLFDDLHPEATKQTPRNVSSTTAVGPIAATSKPVDRSDLLPSSRSTRLTRVQTADKYMDDVTAKTHDNQIAPQLIDEEVAHAVIEHRKKDVGGVMILGAEWDVVAKEEVDEDAWVAVDVDETEAKVRFSKVDAWEL